MKKRKNHYRNNLPHYQHPGQTFFITWNLQDAVPPHALKRYKEQQKIAYSQWQLYKKQGAPEAKIKHFKQEYFDSRRKYFMAYEKLLDIQKEPGVNLAEHQNRAVIEQSLSFWENQKLESYAWCIMPNHVHWVVSLFEKDENEQLIYLQDILYSVKLFSARRINQFENRNGQLWQHENFDTTIRNEKHLHYVIEYTLNNPVVAGLVKSRDKWLGTRFFSKP